MSQLLIMRYVLCSAVLFIHILGLLILYRQKYLSRNKNQIYLLIALCQTESIIAVLSIPHLGKLLKFLKLHVEILWFSEKYFAILNYFFMVLLTLDRFLVFYFTMKYPIYCTLKKLLKILYMVIRR